jgi:hypothetical protein
MEENSPYYAENKVLPVNSNGVHRPILPNLALTRGLRNDIIKNNQFSEKIPIALGLRRIDDNEK